MRINIVTAPDWILREYADNWAIFIPNCKVSTEVDETADINFFINYALYCETGTLTASYFTHRETDELHGDFFDEVARESDLNISMCKVTKEKVDRVSRKPSYIVRPGINPAYVERPLRIGVVARKYPSGRKRLDWMMKVAMIDGVEVDYANGKYRAEEMPEFYAKQDYILITASNEGGPMPVPEAIACGKPLIMPRGVGWCDEFPGIRYDSYEELEGIVKGLVYNHDTYKEGAEELTKLFNGLHR